MKGTTGALPLNRVLLIPSAEALPGRRSGATTAAAAPTCTIWKQGRVESKYSAYTQARECRNDARKIFFEESIVSYLAPPKIHWHHWGKGRGRAGESYEPHSGAHFQCERGRQCAILIVFQQLFVAGLLTGEAENKSSRLSCNAWRRGRGRSFEWSR